MDLQEGFPLLVQQYKALFVKNLLLSWRNKRSTFIQLFSSFFFIALIFFIQVAVDARSASSPGFKNEPDPKPLGLPAIPACEEKYYAVRPCIDFAWSGSDSARVREIVRRIRENNPGRSIPAEKVKEFRTPNETDTWLASNPMHCFGVLHLEDKNTTVISYGIQTNYTPPAKRGKPEDPISRFQIPLQLAAEREIARSLIGDPSFSWVVSLKDFAHPALEIFSAVQSAGPTFFLASAMFSFVFQISALITEKELKLRQAMSMMGLFDTAYWLSWLTWEGILTVISSLLTVLFGMIFQLDFFLHNSAAVVFLMFFLFQLNMTGFAFMLSAFISKSSSSITVGYFIFILGFLTQLITTSGFPYAAGVSKTYRNVWSMFPPNLLAQGLKLLSGATATSKDPGVSWKGKSKCTPNDAECVLTINGIYIWLVSTACLWFVLAIYLDNIIPNSSGVRKPVLYFLNPGYWTGKGGNRWKEGGIFSFLGSIPSVEYIPPDDEDVREEESIVKQQATEGIVDSNTAVQIRGLVKSYAGTTKLGCFKCERTTPYHAIKGIWLNFPKDQLFCLLGPNGAGKTTTINCLTGITPVTSGDALIYGNSIRSPIGMSTIRRIIGVCPQFDILWDLLSGTEHLNLFASIKGLPPDTISSVAEKLLAEVRLGKEADVRSISYSGGMRRRLSVAVALIGEPKLVIMDEPTTGMDPVTRRHVWDVIEGAKKGRAIILTTHSMEEADILSDRIGIMAKGRLRCIGTSIRLKSRFGTGFIANISFAGDVTDTVHHEAVKGFFKSRLDVEPKEENKSFLTFVIPHGTEKLLKVKHPVYQSDSSTWTNKNLPRQHQLDVSPTTTTHQLQDYFQFLRVNNIETKSFFGELQERGDEFGIADIQLGLTTLEEVFLNIAKKAELESALAEGSFATVKLHSGTSIQVPIGARFIAIPGTESIENPNGVMIEVYWQQDESGALCVSGHSTETPVPSHVSIAPNTTDQKGGKSGRTKEVYGIVIEPSQIVNSLPTLV